MKEFTKALTKNIERTYTYSFAKNNWMHKGNAEAYDPVTFFKELLENANPFKIFMELDGFAFKRALENIRRYEIPYTAEEERKARIYHDITNKMQACRSDYVSEYMDDLNDLKDTGIVLYKRPYVLTTEETLYVVDELNRLPRSKKTFNVVYENSVPPLLKKSQEQYEALEKCLAHHISCLIGGAGTGKSFVTSSIVHQLQKNKKEVVVLAPTHKAREALQDKLNVEKVNVTVKTIHSFVHNPSYCQVIVIDESGMLSTPLFSQLLKNYANQKLVFVGDKNQIPPVEYGRPFERIQELFPVAELKENRRSEAADIIALGREILGIPQNANMKMPNIEVVSSSEEAFKQGAEVALTYTNNIVKEINEEQRIKNGKPTISPKVSVGDVLVAKTNNRERHFFNGQIFKMIGRDIAQNKNSKQTVSFKSQKDLESNFDLAYGLTIHKSQGSEWDTVAYLPNPIDTKNLAYVAVTRAKKKLIIIGNDIKTEYKDERPWRHIG
ncbi:ATP-dependent DNA helicase [Tetragenococcus koreensis]|uniref:ATP-dependent DNA helicase n=1 Tax=Tetragenococcus koreensis TaxID=290335 RepID=UPI001F4776D6|nr:AAA family ATPase [Tetragenococcus koreensis]MCF1632917.1 AAA family ATPase [Tetragenococcus koreensis]